MLFQYARLAQDSIRLVEFHPSSTASDIHLTLSHQSRYFDKTSHYTAIWYPSGTSSVERKSLTLNGRTRTVPSNAWDALSIISEYGGRDHKYWIDAVCINQADEAEKKTHSQQMGRIFSSAEKVYLWMGASDETVEKAFAAVQERSSPNPDDVADLRSLASTSAFAEALSKSELHLETAFLLSGRLQCRFKSFQEHCRSLSHDIPGTTRQNHGSL